MKKQDWQKLLAKEVPELQAEVRKLQQERVKKQHEKVVGKLANPRILTRLADDIARLLTVIRERELA